MQMFRKVPTTEMKLTLIKGKYTNLMELNINVLLMRKITLKIMFITLKIYSSGVNYLPSSLFLL